jgi:hypothetical protein
MPRFIASYDLNEQNSPHYEFLEAAKKHGWEPWILSSNNKWYRLPNTTLAGSFDNQEAAVSAFKAIKPSAEAELGSSITLEKWIVANYSESTFISDQIVDA